MMPSEDVAEAIAQVSRRLDRALVDGDAEEAARHFTMDAILGESGIDDVTGRPAIRAFLQKGNAVRTVVNHELFRTELYLLGVLALEYGWFDETKRLRDGVVVQERGRTMTLWRHDDDGAWRIHRLVISDLPLPLTGRGSGDAGGDEGTRPIESGTMQ